MTKQRIWTWEETKRLKRLRDRGLSITEMGVKLGRTFNSVRRRIGLMDERGWKMSEREASPEWPEGQYAEMRRLWLAKNEDGKCEECGCDLTGRRWDADHAIPDAIGGEPTLENCVILCAGPGSCHLEKTRLVDIPRAAKCKRQARKLGVERGQHPEKRKKKIQSAGFPKGIRRRMDGTVEKRP